MITVQDLELYARYRGDVDHFQRLASAADQAAIQPPTWGQIDQLLTDLRNLKAGLVSDEYAGRIRENLAAQAPDPAAQATLLRLATEL